MESLKQALRRNRQFVLYCLIGASCATLDFLVYATLVRAAGLHLQVANAIGHASGTTLSFLLNSRFNFKTRDWLSLRFASFCTVALLGWSASAGMLYLLIQRHGCNKYLAKLLAIAVVVLIQYNLNRLVSFRRTRPVPDPSKPGTSGSLTTGEAG